MQLRHESDHYRFYFDDNDFIRDNLVWLTDIQEKAYEKVSGLLEHTLPSKIRYCLFPDNLSCGRSYDIHAEPDSVTPINAFCYPPAGIHATFNETIKAVGCHEVAHLLLQDWLQGLPAIQLNEGFSVSCDDWWGGMNLDDWCAARLSADNVELFGKIMADEETFFRDQELSYPVAGIYSRWIIRNKGFALYRNFLQDSVADKNAHKRYLPEWLDNLRAGC